MVSFKLKEYTCECIKEIIKSESKCGRGSKILSNPKQMELALKEYDMISNRDRSQVIMACHAGKSNFNSFIDVANNKYAILYEILDAEKEANRGFDSLLDAKRMEIAFKDYGNTYVEVSKKYLNSMNKILKTTSVDMIIMLLDEKPTRFEMARIIGARALQISYGAPVLVDYPDDVVDPIDIAMLEWEKELIPITVCQNKA